MGHLLRLFFCCCFFLFCCLAVKMHMCVGVCCVVSGHVPCHVCVCTINKTPLANVTHMDFGSTSFPAQRSPFFQGWNQMLHISFRLRHKVT